MKQTILVSLRMLLLLTILTGILYPVSTTFIATVLFPRQAGGGLLRRGEQVIGSEHIAQAFQNARYFWPRPSAIEYNPLPSAASNYGPTSRALHDAVELRRRALAGETALSPDHDVPSEMLFCSASGIDPHISPSAAFFQANRVSRARGLNAEAKARVFELIEEHIEERQLGFLGEPRVNVLLLNIALDSLPH
jgi:potassium-transporting ATPase KdpC subunit